jgi:hypothetical protein
MSSVTRIREVQNRENIWSAVNMAAELCIYSYILTLFIAQFQHYNAFCTVFIPCVHNRIKFGLRQLQRL